MKKIKILILVIVVTLSACSINLLPKDTPNLDGTSWTLVKLNGETPIETTTITLSFEGQTVSGNGGCNHYGGDSSYNTNGDLEFSMLFMTEMYCQEAGVSDQEYVYFSALDKVISFGVTDGNLYLANEAGQTVLEYTPQN